MDRELIYVGVSAVAFGVVAAMVSLQNHLPWLITVVVAFVIAYGALMIARGAGWTER